MVDRTDDAFIDGRIRISQPRKGYRFSIDAVILAASVSPKEGEAVLDLGTGCGIMPLILTCRHPGIRVIGVELQQELAESAQMNVSTNQLEDRIRILHADMRTLTTRDVGPVNWIISNPPYRRPRSGRINPNSQKAVARHEISLSLPQLMKSARLLLRSGDRFQTIYPAERMVELLNEMHNSGIEPKWLQCVHTCELETAKLILAQGVRGARSGGLTVAEPLFIYLPDGRYSDKMKEMMGWQLSAEVRRRG